MKKIWILWGMWPQASLHFYQLLIQKVETNIRNPRNQDFPNLLLSNIPVPDLIKGKDDINTIETTIRMVNKEAKTQEKAWASFLVMPCNTMHLFKKDIIKWVNIPFISMIDCVTEKIQKLGFKKVWLLWSRTTMQSQLYTHPLSCMWIETIIPEEYKHSNISQIIHNYIAGTTHKNDIKLLEWYCDDLLESWSELIILWCTELPLILKASFWKYNFLASSEILADSTLNYYYNDL